ncbi:hypothetical protein L226DRAFT_274332 [Lentinus tigrinus ALCF2SS1-7]|uniref:uncharacterized protein n=1 Tax=Lentinus tigrinus ALCF2SS1-7 TaxID=1328758 RepID=UPI0011662903|nr:hypothetical protein L226DRAFT_274332 [Lentinus tigrinus ALCF2SS1-7]
MLLLTGYVNADTTPKTLEGSDGIVGGVCSTRERALSPRKRAWCSRTQHTHTDGMDGQEDAGAQSQCFRCLWLSLHIDMGGRRTLVTHTDREEGENERAERGGERLQRGGSHRRLRPCVSAPCAGHGFARGAVFGKRARDRCNSQGFPSFPEDPERRRAPPRARRTGEVAEEGKKTPGGNPCRKFSGAGGDKS